MATISGKKVRTEDGHITVTWTNLAQATSDVGAGVFVGDMRDLSIQAFGTNTNTVVIQGSNGSVYNDLGSGVTLTIGASGSSPVTALMVNPMLIRPSTPSAGSNTVVVLVGKSNV